MLGRILFSVALMKTSTRSYHNLKVTGNIAGGHAYKGMPMLIKHLVEGMWFKWIPNFVLKETETNV